MTILATALPSLASPEDAPSIDDLVARLDAPALADRDDASRALRDRAGELTDAIGTTINPSELSPEQQARVLHALHQRFILSPRAGLGVSFREDPVEEFKTVGVRIMATVEGFPAARLLQANDLVLEASGAPLTGLPRGYGDLTLRHAILSLDPGEPIRLVVDRGGERLELEVPTKSYSDLNQALPNSRFLEGAWRMRIERLGFGDHRVERLPDEEFEGWNASYKRRQDVPGLLPAGRARPEGDAERSVAALGRLDIDQRTMTKLRLVEEEKARELRVFIEDMRGRLTERQLALRNELPGSKQSDRIVAEIREMERQLAKAQQQYKETRARLGSM